MALPDSQVSCSYILGIESSCDDTAVAVLRTSDGAILGHSIAGQVVLLRVTTFDALATRHFFGEKLPI